MRASPEKKEEKERIRHALLRATLRLAAAHGFASLGLREVSRAADIAPTSFYRHFADMDELGRALVLDFLAPEVRAIAEGMRQHGDASSALVDAVLALTLRDPELMRFFVSERSGAFPALRTALGTQYEALAAILRGELGAHLPGAATDAAVVLVLDGAARALNMPPESVPALRDALVLTLRWLLGDAASVRRQA